MGEELPFEEWKAQQAERVRKIQMEEISVLVEKIQRSFDTTKTKSEKSWSKREDGLLESIMRLEESCQEYDSIYAIQRKLEMQLADIEHESRLFKDEEEDPISSRLDRIHNLQMDIGQLEQELTAKDIELNELTHRKKEYKRIFIEKQGVLRKKS